jgi:ketosteroid isomerase-like protein
MGGGGIGGCVMGIADRVVFDSGTGAFNAHDLDAFSGLLAEDVVFCVPGGIVGVGRAACVESYRRWFREFPDARVAVHSTHVVDDVAVEEGTFTGTHGGVARTGRSVALDYVRVLRFRDGKHVSVKLFFDRLLMLEQLGLVAGCEREL